MRRSMDRILTTHVGNLQRPADLSRAMAAHGQWAPAVLPRLREAVAEVVGRQQACGLDVVSDGEFGKTMWRRYIRDRLDGVDGRDWALADAPVKKARDREQFTDFYAWAHGSWSTFGYTEDAYFWSANATQPVVTGPVRYRPDAVRRDIENLKLALGGQPDAEAFLPVVAPAS